MAKSIRIPFLADIITVASLDEIRALNLNPAVDRSFTLEGPLINRIIKARLLKHTRASLGVLPAFLAREEEGRPQAREALTARLDAISDATIADDPSIPRLAGFVRGDTSASPGPDAQALICRLFNSEFEADMHTWEAALTLQKYLQAKPFFGFMARFSGRLGRAIVTLERAVKGDLEGIHAAGIAIHSLVASLSVMQALYANPVERRRTRVTNVAIRCVQAPERVIRTVNQNVQLPMRRKPVTGDTLILINLANAVLAEAASAPAFQAPGWAACPANGFVPRLLGCIWQAANELENNSDRHPLSRT